MLPSAQRFRTRSFTQELRAASAGRGMLTWLIGGYYSHMHTDFAQALDLVGVGDLLDLPDGRIGELAQTTTTEELAAFGELSLRPVEGLTLTGGLRYSHITLDASSTRAGLIFGGILQDRAHQPQHVVIPKINVSYKVNEDLLVYGQATKGFRIGGLNVTIAPTDDGFVFPRAYDPDSLWNYEVGIKGTALNGVLGFDVDGFIIDWRNIQLNLQRDGCDYFANAGDARSKGIEAQLTLRPTRWLDAGGQLTYTDSKLTRTTPGVGTSRDRVPFVPEVSAAGFVELHDAVGGLPSYARIDVQRVGRAYSGFGSSDNYA